MKLKIISREAETKNEPKRLRREGMIPAVVYEQGKPSKPIVVEQRELDALIRQVKPGRLSTTRITLIDEDNKERQVIFKDIQYHITTYDIIHLDFEELLEDVKVNVNVPIECTGIVDCIGIKLGGVLRQVIRSLRVQCLPKDLPSCFELDVRNLGLRESKRLRELTIPESVRPLMNLDEVAVVIAKR